MAGDTRLAIRARVRGGAADRPRLDVDVEVGQGITVVMGPSGSGKTTLLATVAGLLRPSSGRIVLGDQILGDHTRDIFVPPHRRRVALVFQSLALFPHLSAWENVAYGLGSMTRMRRREAAMAWLTQARVEHVADRMPATLSGGEAQRVAFARALASEPRALLLDEPFSAMDAALRGTLGEELRRLVSAVNIPTLLVTHDRDDAARLGSRVLEIDSGRIVSDRTPIAAGADPVA